MLLLSAVLSFRFVSFSCVPLLRLWLFDCL
nr:MAG TPA: hypothetical protein [Caudoviricetes sp.]